MAYSDTYGLRTDTVTMNDVADAIDAITGASVSAITGFEYSTAAYRLSIKNTVASSYSSLGILSSDYGTSYRDLQLIVYNPSHASAGTGRLVYQNCNSREIYWNSTGDLKFINILSGSPNTCWNIGYNFYPGTNLGGDIGKASNHVGNIYCDFLYFYGRSVKYVNNWAGGSRTLNASATLSNLYDVVAQVIIDLQNRGVLVKP